MMVLVLVLVLLALGVVTPLIVYRVRTRRAPPAPLNESPPGHHYEVRVGDGVQYAGPNLKLAKSIRADLRVRGSDAVLYQDGEYRG